MGAWISTRALSKRAAMRCQRDLKTKNYYLARNFTARLTVSAYRHSQQRSQWCGRGKVRNVWTRLRYMYTRNTHAHLCLTLVLVCRLCACASYAGAACVMFCCRRTVEKLFGVCSIQAMMAPPYHRPRPPAPSPKNAIIRTSIWMCQTHTWLYGLWYVHVTTFHVTFLSMTHHICTNVRTHVYACTYFVRIEPWFRASH